MEQKDTLTDPLKKIELFKAVASPAYIVASLEHFNEVSADFFCPVKKCFEFACEANFRKSTIPEYKREYDEIENRLVYFFGGGGVCHPILLVNRMWLSQISDCKERKQSKNENEDLGIFCQRNWVFATNSDFLIPISSPFNVVDLDISNYKFC